MDVQYVLTNNGPRNFAPILDIRISRFVELWLVDSLTSVYIKDERQ